MAKVLKITKSDKTVHVVPMTNKAFYEAYNRRQKGDKKWKLEEIDEEDAKNLKFIDDTHVTPVEATKKLEEKDAEIAALKAKLAKLSGNEAPVDNDAYVNESAPFKKATEVIELIAASTSEEQVNTLISGDTRKTVIDAADKKIAALKAQ